ncbi:MAG: type II secretion system F family protein [Planctomycetes bacterium]|nr:type II secretion system F family protein [Planctomycetota bacterium]
MAISRSDIYSNLANMTEAGVPLVKSLRLVAKESRRFEKVFNNIAGAVEGGESISGAMRRERKHFPELDINLVEVGERSGRIPEVFHSLANWYLFKNRIFSAFISNLGYPALLLHAAFFIINIPPFILGNITLGQYLANALTPLLIIYLFVFTLIMVYQLSTGRSPLRIVMDTILLKMPLLGRALRDLSLARYCSVFKSMYDAAAPILDCTRLASNACGNAVMAKRLEGATKSVAEGGTVHGGFPDNLPKKFKLIWITGEESGTLSRSLDKLAETYMGSAEFMMAQISRWVPRLVYALVAAFIAYLILRQAANIFGQISEIADF